MTKRQKLTDRRAVTYIRVSTARQATEGLSLEAQQAALRDYCKRIGLDVVAEVDDPGQSAGTPLARRNGGKQLLELIRQKKASHVVVARLDRAWRSALDCLQTIADWDTRGVSLHILDLGGATINSQTSVGKLFLTLLAGMAEFERNVDGDRIASTLAHKFSRGSMRLGYAPYGWRYEGNGLVPVPSEQAAREAVLALAATGLGVRGVCREMEARGFRNRAGTEFKTAQVYRILQGCKRINQHTQTA